MALRKILSSDFIKYPETTRIKFEKRKLQFDNKLGATLQHVQKLKDYRRLFEVTPNGEPMFENDYSNSLFSATTDEHIQKASGYLERSLRKHQGKLKNPFSHIITSMNILRPDLSPLTFRAGEPLFSRLTAAGVNIKPFISLNDFSFISSFYKNDLPEIFSKSLYNNLYSHLIQKFGSQIDWSSGIDKVPFSESQTDHATTIICSFMKRYRDELLRSSIKDTSKIEKLEGYLSKFDHVRGKDIEFSYAPKDISFYKLGNKSGDCSAIRINEMYDKDHENIFCDVPLWVGMPNYQVLEVMHNGKFAMKFHLLIAKVFSKWVLVVDAAETAPEMRDTATNKDQTLINAQDQMFDGTIMFIRELGKKMRLPILANRFSCNDWLMERFRSMPEKVIEFSRDLDRDPITDPLMGLMSAYSSEANSLLNKFDLRPHIQLFRFDPRDELRDGYKLLAIIDGYKKDRFIPIRGL